MESKALPNAAAVWYAWWRKCCETAGLEVEGSILVSVVVFGCGINPLLVFYSSQMKRLIKNMQNDDFRSRSAIQNGIKPE